MIEETRQSAYTVRNISNRLLDWLPLAEWVMRADKLGPSDGQIFLLQ
jgi:hypothetical protein